MAGRFRQIRAIASFFQKMQPSRRENTPRGLAMAAILPSLRKISGNCPNGMQIFMDKGKPDPTTEPKHPQLPRYIEDRLAAFRAGYSVGEVNGLAGPVRVTVLFDDEDGPVEHSVVENTNTGMLGFNAKRGVIVSRHAPTVAAQNLAAQLGVTAISPGDIAETCRNLWSF